ncbi:LexA family protein [Sphingobium sp.]|uniref:LexA family protein n=1 Tax=Sphingobium sp. TaxID=1912891 RepID=UPI002E1F9C79
MGIEIDIPRLSPTMASRKNQVLAFVRLYWNAHSVGPSISEIARAVGCARSRAQKLVTKLVREGHLHRIDGMTRGVRPASVLEEALRQLREAGYVVNDDVIAPPAGAMPLIDIDDAGALVVRGGWTNAPLPPDRARAQRAAPSGGERDAGDGVNRNT